MKWRKNMSTKSIILLGITLAIMSMNSLAFQHVLVIEKPIRAKCLCGQIQLSGSSEGADGVLIEQCTPDWKNVLASAYADKNGFFHFPKTYLKNMHYLRISCYLYRTTCIKVKISPKEKEKILLNLDFY
jgi:hypothetical protein